MNVRERAGVRGDGWQEYSIWEHSRHIRDLYQRRAEKKEIEMTCAAQAAELLRPRVRTGEIVLDAGCGSGYFWHSLAGRHVPAEYVGIDASATLIGAGQAVLPGFGLPADNLRVCRIEDLAGEADHVLCMNVLTHLDNYHRPLERLLRVARRTVIIRESLAEEANYLYVRDTFLDPGVTLKVHVNTYPVAEVIEFMRSYGFRVRQITDDYTGGNVQDVIGYPHYWTFLVGEK